MYLIFGIDITGGNRALEVLSTLRLVCKTIRKVSKEDLARRSRSAIRSVAIPDRAPLSHQQQLRVFRFQVGSAMVTLPILSGSGSMNNVAHTLFGALQQRRLRAASAPIGSMFDT